MLLFLLRHGTSRCLTLRAIPNGLSITTHKAASSHSAQEDEQHDGWTTIRKDVQSEIGVGLRRGDRGTRTNNITLNGPYGTPKNSTDIEATPEWAPSSQEWVREGKDDWKNHKPEETGHSQEKDVDKFPEFRKPPNPESIFSKLSGSIESHAASSTPITKRISSSSDQSRLSKNKRGSSSRNKHADETRADSSFLDQLHKDEVTRRTTEAGLNVPVSEKLSRLREAMAVRNPSVLLKYMVQASDDLEFMNAIPGVTFIELLRQLHPEDDFSPLRSEYKGQGPKHYRMLSGWRNQFYKALRDRRRFYQDLAMRRIVSGRELGLGEYTQLLNLARATWDGPVALDIMKNMIANDTTPNLTCYNHYFEARCWSDAYHPDEMQRLRVMPYNLEMRKSFPKRPVSDDVIVDGHRVEENGIRWEITRMFTKMVNDGINADTRAYCNLIIAQSREGDLRAIKSVLFRVWHVDIDKLLAGEPDSDKNKLSEDSPTYPTNDLLFTLAHTFGSNNDMPAAIRIVDHFSRKYNITIPQLVWGELMQWTFVLSTRRRKGRRLDGAAAGQLPLKSVESLWTVMHGPPYHSEPNLLMYDYLIRSFWRRDRRSLYEYLYYMREGVKFHEQECNAYDAAQREIVALLRQGGELDPESLDSRKIRAEEARSKRWFSFVLVRKWFQLLLSNQRWLKEPWEREVKWSRKMLPDAVKEFWRYKAHQPIAYPVAGGRVELDDPVAEQEWAMRKVGREERWGMGIEEWEAREASGMEGERFVGGEEWTDEEREILEEDEREVDRELAEERAEEIRQELDDL